VTPEIFTAVTDSEAACLRALARDRKVLEVGAQFGFSTVLMAQVAEYVVSVDWHRGDDNAGWQDSWPQFQQNLTRYAVVDRVVPIVARSLDAFRHLRDGAFELVFHDGMHDYRGVHDDLRAVRPLLGAGYLAVHDYGRFDGLTRACHEVLGTPDQVVGTLAVYRLTAPA